LRVHNLSFHSLARRTKPSFTPGKVTALRQAIFLWAILRFSAPVQCLLPAPSTRSAIATPNCCAVATLSGIVCHLDSLGCNRLKSGARPRPPKRRIIDLRAGDDVLVNGRWQRIEKIVAFSDTWITEEQGARPRGDEGYLYRPPPGFVPEPYCVPNSGR
jgi:hypothetical protein